MSRSNVPTHDPSLPIDLDSPDTYERFDRNGMSERIGALPRQAREAWSHGCDWPLPDSLRERPSRVLILAVGGSAVGGDVVSAIASSQSRVPIQLVRNYSLPALDERTLVVACSFSGETEEVVAAFGAALSVPGPRLAITTGGALAKIAAAARVPIFKYNMDGPPRAALGYSVFATLAILARANVLAVDADAIDETLDGLEQDKRALTTAVPTAANDAKLIASWMYGGAPVVIGADVLEVAARRWASQINENAKQWAFAAALPEMNHNLVMGLSAPRAVRDHIRAVVLDGAPVHSRNRERVKLTLDELRAAGVPSRILHLPGVTALEAVVRGAYRGDWISLYLAMLNGVDPSTTDPISRLKAQLARRPSS